MIWVKLGSWIPLTSNSTISKWICGEGPCSDKKKRMRKYRCYRPWKKWGENTSHTYTTKYKYISIYIYVNIYICVYKWIYIYMYKQKQINKYVYIYILYVYHTWWYMHTFQTKNPTSPLYTSWSASHRCSPEGCYHAMLAMLSSIPSETYYFQWMFFCSFLFCYVNIWGLLK
jgi:hypothetical protein